MESEQETAGFLNSAILRNAYVIGATRNTYLDLAGGLLDRRDHRGGRRARPPALRQRASGDGGGAMAERIYLLPGWLRVWHWTNASLIIVLAVTGASLHFAGPGMPLVPFNLARATHNVAGLALAAAYGFFVVANVVSGNWWQYVPKPGGFWRKVVRQMRFYAWGIFLGEPHPYPPTLEPTSTRCSRSSTGW